MEDYGYDEEEEKDPDGHDDGVYLLLCNLSVLPHVPPTGAPQYTRPGGVIR